MFPHRIQYISFHPCASVFRSDKNFSEFHEIPLQEKISVPITQNNLYVARNLPQFFCQLQKRRNADTAPHQQRCLSLRLLQRITVSENTQHFRRIPLPVGRKLFCSLPRHPVYNAQRPSLRISLTDTDRSRQKRRLVFRIESNKTARPSFLCHVCFQPHFVYAFRQFCC